MATIVRPKPLPLVMALLLTGPLVSCTFSKDDRGAGIDSLASPSHTPLPRNQGGQGHQVPPVLTPVLGVLDRGGNRIMGECAALGSGTENCFWTYSLDPTLCSGSRCSKLVIYFSGGQMSCPAPDDDGKYLRAMAKQGYVAVCARVYETAAGSGAVPMHVSASRVNAVVKNIVADKMIRRAWSGEHLLFSGVSNGATTPLIAMARTSFDGQAAWKGSKYTAACFYDGVYDAKAQFTFLRQNTCGKINSLLSYQRAYSRYCHWPSSGFTLPVNWPTPQSCSNGDTAADTLTGIDPSLLSIKHWKLIECGSALPACFSDVAPAVPIETLCNKIKTDNQHTCDFQAFPNVGHARCGGSNMPTIAACLDWFDGRILQARKMSLDLGK